MRPSDSDPALEVIERYLAAVNAEDWPSLSQLFATDARLRAVGTRERRGRTEIMTYYTSLFDPWVEHQDLLIRALPSGSSVTAEIRFVGTTETPRTITFDAVDIFDLADGRVSALSICYDLVEVRRLLTA